MNELTNKNNGLQATIEMVEMHLKNARVLAETAFGMAKFNLESIEGELRTAEALCLCDQTLSNIREREMLAVEELVAAKCVMIDLKRAHINLKSSIGMGEFSSLAQ